MFEYEVMLSEKNLWKHLWLLPIRTGKLRRIRKWPSCVPQKYFQLFLMDCSISPSYEVQEFSFC